MRGLVSWQVESKCSASKQQRSEARDCQWCKQAADARVQREVRSKRLSVVRPLAREASAVVSTTVLARTLSEGGGCSPVSRCRPEPSHSRSGPFRRPGLPGESAGPKRNGNMQSIFLHCSCVGVAVVECVFFWAAKHQQTLVATYPDGHRVAERPKDQSCTSATMLCI